MPLDIREYLVCGTCDNAVTTDDHEDGPLYECQSCGRQFARSNSADGESHRCPDCNKMAGKAGDYGCGECDEEMEIKDGAICPHCDKFIAEDE